MNKKKKISEWFSDLPEPIRGKALHNHRKETYEGCIEYRAFSIHVALDLGFTWNNSPEGFEYWMDVYNDLKK